jgi:hypothetical protein
VARSPVERTGMLIESDDEEPHALLSTLRRMGRPITTRDSLPGYWPSSAGRDWLPAGFR